MNTSGVLAVLVALVAWNRPDAAAGEELPAAPARVITRSASGRFVVEGPDSASNSQYTRWAEEVAQRLERLMAVRFPLGKHDESIEIILGFGKMAGPGIEARCWRENGLRRCLKINEFRLPDYDLMQDSLCALLLDGYLESLRREKGLAPGAPSVPQWFSMGLSQNLSSETRIRNRKIVTRWPAGTERPGLADVLRWRTLPEGWPRNRALCGMAVHWMGSSKDGPAAYGAVMGRLADGEAVTAAWVAERFAHVANEDAVERLWQEWLARQGRAVQEFGELSGVLLDQLRADVDLIVPVADGPRRLDPAALIEMSPRPAQLRHAAAEKIQSIRALTLGKASELVDVGEAYCRFFEAVSRDAWTPVLRFRLARAEAAFDRLSALTRAREAYLDEVERDLAAVSGTAPARAATSEEPVLEKSRIEAYLDEAEKRSRPESDR